MSNSNSSNKVSVPEAKEAMNRFKQEVASELGVPLKEGYNGDLTSRQAGSIGGEMVKKMISISFIAKSCRSSSRNLSKKVRHPPTEAVRIKTLPKIFNIFFLSSHHRYGTFSCHFLLFLRGRSCQTSAVLTFLSGIFFSKALSYRKHVRSR